MLACEVTLESTLFDPSVRDELTAFFAKALHSNYRQRFDSAEEMLRAWRWMFTSVDRPATDTDNGSPVDLGQALTGATEETQLSTLGLCWTRWNASARRRSAAAARAQYTEEPGRRADEVAAADPLLTPSRAMEELQAVTPVSKPCFYKR